MLAYININELHIKIYILHDINITRLDWNYFHEPFSKVCTNWHGFSCPKCVVNLVYDAGFSSQILLFTSGQEVKGMSTLIVQRIKHSFMFMNIFKIYSSMFYERGCFLRELSL